MPRSWGQENGCSADNADQCSFSQILKRAMLDRYEAAFIADGYNSKQAIALMNESQLKEFIDGALMRPGHRNLMMNFWKNAQKEVGEKAPMTYDMPKIETFDAERKRKYE